MNSIKSKIKEIISVKKPICGMIIDVGNARNVEQPNKNCEYKYVNLSLRALK